MQQNDTGLRDERPLGNTQSILHFKLTKGYNIHSFKVIEFQKHKKIHTNESRIQIFKIIKERFLTIIILRITCTCIALMICIVDLACAMLIY